MSLSANVENSPVNKWSGSKQGSALHQKAPFICEQDGPSFLRGHRKETCRQEDGACLDNMMSLEWDSIGVCVHLCLFERMRGVGGQSQSESKVREQSWLFFRTTDQFSQDSQEIQRTKSECTPFLYVCRAIFNQSYIERRHSNLKRWLNQLKENKPFINYKVEYVVFNKVLTNP